mmetsp:Transcript_26976/g.69270  ORF Transcript_26976/g.69270 Transcript_26976/m.69270 type:complete len:253 (-) Transcript_26976:10-768(-)
MEKSSDMSTRRMGDIASRLSAARTAAAFSGVPPAPADAPPLRASPSRLPNRLLSQSSCASVARPLGGGAPAPTVASVPAAPASSMPGSIARSSIARFQAPRLLSPAPNLGRGSASSPGAGDAAEGQSSRLASARFRPAEAPVEPCESPLGGRGVGPAPSSAVPPNLLSSCRRKEPVPACAAAAAVAALSPSTRNDPNAWPVSARTGAAAAAGAVPADGWPLEPLLRAGSAPSAVAPGREAMLEQGCELLQPC